MNWKKMLALLLTLALLLGLTACGVSEETVETASEVVSAVLEAAAETEEEPAESEEPEAAQEPAESEEPEAVQEPAEAENPEEAPETPALAEDGTYTGKDDVALYLYTYGHLPDNFITKKEAQNLGWSGGSLEPYAPGKCIGGSRFGNYEGILPDAPGRTWTECDIDTLGAEKRGAKRIVFSNDGLIYYTEDHYETFTLLYGDPES